MHGFSNCWLHATMCSRYFVEAVTDEPFLTRFKRVVMLAFRAC